LSPRRAQGERWDVRQRAAARQCDERAILAEHPKGNLAEPVIRFPCALGDLREGLEQLGVYGCIDAFDMAEWFKNKGNSNDTPMSASRAHVSDKLAKINQASTKFWGNADRDDRGTHPKNVTVAAWLEQQCFSATLANSAARIAEADFDVGRQGEALVVGHLLATIPSQRFVEFPWQLVRMLD